MAQINGVAYSWSMIQLQTNLEGESAQSPIFVDCTSIKWNTERKIEPIYGLGGQPRKRGFGNVTYEASIVLPYVLRLLFVTSLPTALCLALVSSTSS